MNKQKLILAEDLNSSIEISNMMYVVLTLGSLWFIWLMLYIFRGVADYVDKDDHKGKG